MKREPTHYDLAYVPGIGLYLRSDDQDDYYEVINYYCRVEKNMKSGSKLSYRSVHNRMDGVIHLDIEEALFIAVKTIKLDKLSALSYLEEYRESKP